VKNKDTFNSIRKLSTLFLGFSYLAAPVFSHADTEAHSPNYQGYRVVAYTLKTCVHCQRMASELASLQETPGLQVEVVEIIPGSNLRKHRQAQQRAQMAGVTGFPTLVIFFGNEKVSTLRGYTSAEAVRNHVGQLSNNQ